MVALILFPAFPNLHSTEPVGPLSLSMCTRTEFNVDQETIESQRQPMLRQVQQARSNEAWLVAWLGPLWLDGWLTGLLAGQSVT
eukprot:1024810-Heterocapsa_arctica.AAC.1